MQYTPWKVNAQSFMIMYTILAATAGIFLVGVLIGAENANVFGIAVVSCSFIDFDLAFYSVRRRNN
jgi:hypothetical protein